MKKYIVYQTTNLINNKIYIGIHGTINPNIFDGYIGCGVYITQPNTYNHPKTAFQYAVQKYGPSNFKRTTLAIFDTVEEASNLERDLVNEKFLMRDDVYNMALGGYDEAMQFKIKTYQYNLDGNFITEHESVEDAALSVNCHHTAIEHAVHKKCKIKNFFWNQDKVEKLDLSNYNLGNNHQIKVYMYDIDGNYLKEYPNQTQCIKNEGGNQSSLKQSRLFGILYLNKYYISTVKAKTFSQARTEYVKNRTVYKYDGNSGNFICEYNSQIEAELENPNSNISKSIRLKTTCKNNFLWGVEKLENYNKQINRCKKRKVGKYDLNGNLVKIYESATQAEKENGTSVWKVLNGTNKTHKNHTYKYLS